MAGTVQSADGVAAGPFDADKELSTVLQEWKKFSLDFEALENSHEQCTNKLNEIQKKQAENIKSVTQQNKRLVYFKDSLKRLKQANVEHPEELEKLICEVGECKNRLVDITHELPLTNNGFYLSMILGSTLNLSITNKNDKFRYKDDYEKFKLSLSIVAICVMSVAFMFPFRICDAAADFLLVAYYCTLTVRESILIVNGSRIKGWWLTHHYVSAVLCGITVTWPDGPCYQAFRVQFVVFCLYTSVVQLLQCQYQRGCLRRLRALGHRHEMDISVDGFHSWMFKGLTFLLPFLLFGYAFQLYNSYCLLYLQLTLACHEWQVPAASVIFLLLAAGNSWTTGQVIYRKYLTKEKPSVRRQLETKYATESSRKRSTAL